MTSSRKGMKVFLIAAVAAVALSALVASSAAAAIVPAKFSSPEFKVTTTGLTLKRNGLEPKTCTFKYGSANGAGGEEFFFYNNVEGDTRFFCPTSGVQLQMISGGKAQYDTVTKKYNLRFNSKPSFTLASPWGSYWQNVEFDGAWVNGSGATASTVTLTNQTIGFTTAGSQKLTLEGTIKVTTPSGGLITLSP